MPHFRQQDPSFIGHVPEWVKDFLAPDLQSPTWILGPDKDFTAPATIWLGLPAHYELIRHGHPCYRFEVILRGTLILPDGAVLEAGDVMTASPNELYGPHIAGPEGCDTIEFFSELEGLYRMLTEEADGSVREWDYRKGEVPPQLDRHIVSAGTGLPANSAG